ncbi:MAG: hypothetical protein Q7R52_00105 [archaeon]|nr:hypothetical protein [archaeon]
MEVKVISAQKAKYFIKKNHYAIISPPINKLSLGLFKENKLVGVAMWGYGVRPKHTLKLMFPSLEVENYFELNRLCLLDEMPRNSESQFISENVKYIKKYFPKIKVLFSWADGLRGKCGYVYQASNFYYGGKILSEFYATKEGEVVHPRLLITRFGRRDMDFAFKELKLKKIKGYQLRYCKFLCSHKERKKLIKESSCQWNFNYIKNEDLKWIIIDAEEGSRESRQAPSLKGTGQFRHSALSLQGLKQNTLQLLWK